MQVNRVRRWALVAVAVALMVPVWFVDDQWYRAILVAVIVIAFVVAIRRFATRSARPS
jgi:uncharacterized membrane protein YbaN (DUF454 family)